VYSVGYFYSAWLRCERHLRARMSSRRVGISPVKRPLCDDAVAVAVAVPSSPVRCPICGLDLSGTFEADRDAHADACASALSQRANDGNDTSSVHNAVAVTNADDDDDDLIVVRDDFEERRAEMASSSSSARILGSETIEAWLTRIGMVKYFALYVSEDLLDVEIARECTEEDLVGIGVRKEDARVLARCGALASSAKRHQPTVAASTHPVIVRRIAREALAAAKLRAQTNAERLWDVAKGAEDPAPRGRGESLPHISRLLPKPT